MIMDDRDYLLPEELPPGHRSGFVAVVGKPNVGKSTLMNAYLGQKIAIVSEKPQTTRNRLLGILTLRRARGDPADAQAIFVDTPGIHSPRHKLGEFMVETAVRAIPDADVVVFLVDVSTLPGGEDVQIAELIREKCQVPVLLALNKVDLLTPEDVQPHTESYQALGDFADWMLISATRGDNRDKLLDLIVSYLPEGPRYYPEEQVTDQQERFIAAELIREAVLRHTHQEIPHAVAVMVEEFRERGPEMTYIAANIFVEKDSQKGIVIGQGGRMLKRIGREARKEIEEMVGTRVYLELRVKVKKKWRRDKDELRRLGYALSRRKR
jgi:GTP-binding protein Era